MDDAAIAHDMDAVSVGVSEYPRRFHHLTIKIAPATAAPNHSPRPSCDRRRSIRSLTVQLGYGAGEGRAARIGKIDLIPPRNVAGRPLESQNHANAEA